MPQVFELCVCLGEGCDRCNWDGSITRAGKADHVLAELEGLRDWLQNAVQSNPQALNISFNKFELASLHDRINAIIKETNWKI